MFKRVLVPLDGSRFGVQAFRHAIEIAQRFDAEVTLLQIVPPAKPVTGTVGIEPYMESPATAELAIQVALEEDKKNITRARRYLSRKVRQMKTLGVNGRYTVIVGKPAQSILKFSKKEKIDLVVMTTHGKSGLKRALVGSVADEVIRTSGKPVLVLKP